MPRHQAPSRPHAPHPAIEPCTTSSAPSPRSPSPPPSAYTSSGALGDDGRTPCRPLILRLDVALSCILFSGHPRVENCPGGLLCRPVQRVVPHDQSHAHSDE